jgi:putative OPT family oligopeptide transporter
MTHENPHAITHENATDAEWLQHIYRKNEAQLTLRSMIMGSLLGGFMSLSNLYIGLKTGWGLGVAITACILSFAISKTLRGIFPKIMRTDMSLLENCNMQAAATSAGVSTGSTIISAIAAYLIVTGEHIPWPVLMIWTFCLAALGVFVSIPIARQMVNKEKLRFPSGLACAETLKSLHATGEEAIQKAQALGIGGILGALVAWFRDAGKPFSIPSSLAIPGSAKHFAFGQLTISIDMSLIMIAGGAIMGWKIAWSMLLGAIVNFGYLAPHMAREGAIDASNMGYRAIMGWSTWVGASMMVTSGLFYFALQFKTIGRALTQALKKKASSEVESNAELKSVLIPNSWFVGGTAVSGIAVMALLWLYFGTTLWMGFVAIALSFVLALVAARATGETDTTPVGAMGKITQLTYGVLAPSNMVTNLMTASVTAGIAGSAADLCTVQKTGYILGANPRKLFLAILIGIFAGTIVVVPAFYLIIPTPDLLGSDMWPAPSAQVWATVAKLLGSGLDALHPLARMGMIVGGLVGLFIPVLEMTLPVKWRKFVPSATGVGLAFVIPFFNSLSMFIGALIALILEKTLPAISEKYVVASASGIIAGESLLGVFIAILSVTGVL